MKEHNQLLNAEKFLLLRTSVTYLDHVINKDSVSPDPSKVEAIKKFPTPSNTKDLKSFLGLAGYYKRFIKNFAKIAKSLNSLFKEGMEFIWWTEQENAFDNLKQKLMSNSILNIQISIRNLY